MNVRLISLPSLLFFLSLFIILLARTVVAQTTFEVNGLTVSLKLPQNWKAQSNIMGYPLLLSPTDQSTDSLMLGITSLNATPEADLDSMLIDYKLERLPWLADAKGKLIKFEKPAIFEPGPGVSGTVFGISYKISGQLFSEKSYYLRCKEHSFSLKYLISSEEEKYIPTIEKIIGSFTCL